MSRSRRATAALTAAAAMLALSAGLFVSGAVPGTSTASASVPPAASEGSSIHAKTTTARRVRVILPSIYDLAPLGSAVPSSLAAGEAVATISDLPVALAQKGDFLGASLPGSARADRTIVFSPDIAADATIAFRAAQ